MQLWQIWQPRCKVEDVAPIRGVEKAFQRTPHHVFLKTELLRATHGRPAARPGRLVGMTARLRRRSRRWGLYVGFDLKGEVRKIANTRQKTGGSSAPRLWRYESTRGRPAEGINVSVSNANDCEGPDPEQRTFSMAVPSVAADAFALHPRGQRPPAHTRSDSRTAGPRDDPLGVLPQCGSHWIWWPRRLGLGGQRVRGSLTVGSSPSARHFSRTGPSGRFPAGTCSDRGANRLYGGGIQVGMAMKRLRQLCWCWLGRRPRFFQHRQGAGPAPRQWLVKPAGCKAAQRARGRWLWQNTKMARIGWAILWRARRRPNPGPRPRRALIASSAGGAGIGEDADRSVRR